MNCSLLALRKLKYRFLPAFIGREVSIPSIDQVEESVLVFVSTLISARFKLKTSEESLSGVMRKHGFLDLTLVSADQVLGRGDRISRAVIRELGYSPRPKDPAPDLPQSIKGQLGNDRSCLELLIEDVIEQGCFLRLFLDSKWSADSMMRYWDATQRECARGLSEDLAMAYAMKSLDKQMRGWFPVTFTVIDACLSNSDSVWLAKRVYL